MDAIRLHWHGRALELRTGRAGLRTTATLREGSTPIAEGRGVARVLLRLPEDDGPAPTVLVLAPWPGVVARAVLLEPRTAEPDDEPAEPVDASGGDAEPDPVPAVLDLATAARHPFAPAPGSPAARLLALQERHPRLWAARHVVLGVGKVLAGLLGIAVLLQTLVRPLLRWLSGLLPSVDLPELPLPDIDVPWPDVDLPEFTLPGWVAAVLATAKFWAPVLVGLVLAVREVRKRRAPAHGGSGAGPGDDARDAHRRP